MMKRLILPAILAATLTTVPTAQAHNYGDCSWQEAGETLQFPDGLYRCECVRMRAPDGQFDVWCSWRVTTASKARRKLTKPKALLLPIVIRITRGVA